MKTKQQIVADIKGHIAKRDGGYSAWYCGIAADAKARLKQHKVNLENGHWIYRSCANHNISRAVEDYFLELGCEGGGGGGDDDTTQVYAYEITNSTCETC
jgi:hypothetical protein